MAFFHRFKKKTNIIWSLLGLFGFSLIAMINALSWASDFNETGKFILKIRSSVSIQYGVGAVVTILTMKWIAIVLFCAGMYYTLSAFISFKENSFETEPQIPYSICPSCMKLSATEHYEHQRCKECNVPLEPVMGFWERHPEHGINVSSLKDDGCGKK